MPKKRYINLLPQEEFESSTAGRILKWAASTFRTIVIVVEVVVMGAFLSRFWLDSQNSDLSQNIKILSAQISAQADAETKFREVQSKLDIYNKISSNPSLASLMETAVTNTPPNVTLTRISVENGNIEIRGSSLSDIEIRQFVIRLSASKFNSVELKQISSSEVDPGITNFVIIAGY